MFHLHSAPLQLKHCCKNQSKLCNKISNRNVTRKDLLNYRRQFYFRSYKRCSLLGLHSVTRTNNHKETCKSQEPKSFSWNKRAVHALSDMASGPLSTPFLVSSPETGSGNWTQSSELLIGTAFLLLQFLCKILRKLQDFNYAIIANLLCKIRWEL